MCSEERQFVSVYDTAKPLHLLTDFHASSFITKPGAPRKVKRMTNEPDRYSTCTPPLVWVPWCHDDRKLV